MIEALIFDWGDTVMRDYPEMPGPMFSWPHVELVPGVLQVLEQFSTKYQCDIATNAGCSDTIAMRKALQRVDAERYFRFFFSSKDLGYQKPDPRFFTAISTSIGIAASNCLMIGNSYDKDICSAQAAGMQTMFFNEKAIAGHYPQAGTIFQHFDQLIQLL